MLAKLRWPTVSTILAVGLTIILVGAMNGTLTMTEKEQTSAILSFVETLAVIWATKYAADNLWQLKEVEAARARPFLEIASHKAEYTTEYRVVIQIHNLGAGSVIGVRASSTLIGDEGARFEEEPLRLSEMTIAPLGSVKAEIRSPHGLGFVFFKAVEVQVEFQGSARRREHMTWILPIESGWPRPSGQFCGHRYVDG